LRDCQEVSLEVLLLRLHLSRSALRGIQPNFAPLSFTNLITADKAPVVSAARSPTKITDLAVNPLNVEIAATSLPVAVLINFAFSF